MRDATFSLAITPSLGREMLSGSVDAGFVLALPFHYGDLVTLNLTVQEFRRGWGGEESARRRDATNASGRLASFSVEGRGSRALLRSSWRFHRCCGWSAFAADNLTVDSRVRLKNLRSIETHFSCGSGSGLRD